MDALQSLPLGVGHGFSDGFHPIEGLGFHDGRELVGAHLNELHRLVLRDCRDVRGDLHPTFNWHPRAGWQLKQIIIMIKLIVFMRNFKIDRIGSNYIHHRLVDSCKHRMTLKFLDCRMFLEVEHFMSEGQPCMEIYNQTFRRDRQSQ